MATRGFHCLFLPIREIDLPVKRRGCHDKTRRPYGASINQPKNTPLSSQGTQNNTQLGWQFRLGRPRSIKNPPSSYKLRLTSQSHMNHHDPRPLINETSYPRDNSAILFKSPYRQLGFTTSMLDQDIPMVQQLSTVRLFND